jgi:hypothetical protein
VITDPTSSKKIYLEILKTGENISQQVIYLEKVGYESGRYMKHGLSF